eukprot:739134-Pleurochrysis_carterae.AAC.1
MSTSPSTRVPQASSRVLAQRPRKVAAGQRCLFPATTFSWKTECTGKGPPVKSFAGCQSSRSVDE